MNLTWQLTAVIIALLAVIAMVIWLEYRRSQKANQKKARDPFIVTLFVTLAITLILFVMEALDVLPEGWAKDHWYVFIIMIAAIFYWSYQQLKKLKPLKEEKLIQIGWDHIDRIFKASPNRGAGYGPPLPLFKVIETSKGIFNKTIQMLYHTTAGNILLGMDINNGYLVECMHNPPEEVVRRRFGKEIAQQFDLERELIVKDIFNPEQQDQYHENNPQIQPTA